MNGYGAHALQGHRFPFEEHHSADPTRPGPGVPRGACGGHPGACSETVSRIASRQGYRLSRSVRCRLRPLSPDTVLSADVLAGRADQASRKIDPVL